MRTCRRLERRDGAAAYRARRAPANPARRSSILAENPFSINCLYRRCRARLGACGQEHLELARRERSTVPMSRPSATSPGGSRKARWRAEQRLAHGRQHGDRDARVADLLGADRVADIFRAEVDCAAVEADVQVLGDAASASLVVAARCRGAAPTARPAGTARRCRDSGSPGVGDLCGDRALAGRGRAVDRDDRSLERTPGIGCMQVRSWRLAIARERSK